MSAYRIEFHPDAVLEARAARLWYRERDQESAEAFLLALDRALDLIAEAPERWPPYLHQTHRILMSRFPFAVVYRLDGETKTIQIIAITHQSRRPGYWAAR